MHTDARVFCVLFVLHKAEFNNNGHDQSNMRPTFSSIQLFTTPLSEVNMPLPQFKNYEL